MMISAVVPVYNEEKTLPVFYKRLSDILTSQGKDFEIIFVDDGSDDNSLFVINDFHQTDPRIKALSFSRNFGHQVAISAGLQYARGDAVVIMDADLQDPPEVIPQLLKKWQEGFEVVSGIREKREDNIFKVFFCGVYYRLLKILSNTNIDLDSGDFCLMDRKIVNLLKALPERNRFIRGLRNWVGPKSASVKYQRNKRYAGRTKYSLSKLFKLAFDGIISFSGMPLKISLTFGFLISLGSIIYSLYIIWCKIFDQFDKIPGWASLVVSITFLGGIQLMVLGFLGEYILRIFDEVKGRPLYVLKSTLGFDNHGQSIGNHPRT